MQSTRNKIVIASAGSGKTTFLVKEALSHAGSKILVVTYTNNNIREIKKKFHEIHGGVPSRVDVMTWFAFLLRECARPYQRAVYPERRVKTVHFPEGRSPRGISSSDIRNFYFKDGDEIYADKISRFTINCEVKSNGLVTNRIAEIYDEVYVDEFQDLSGYDLDLLGIFMRAGIRMLIVGDPRQCTYVTNNAAKNSHYRGMGILTLVCQWEKAGMCEVGYQARSYRCNQQICDFADALWPNIEKTVSVNTTITDHDGVFIVSKDNLNVYTRKMSPVVLRYDRKTETHGYSALNFGNVKGMTFDRVLIIPHGPIKRYLKSADARDVEGSVEKFYVAVTRARHSVAFLYDGVYSVGCTRWAPSE